MSPLVPVLVPVPLRLSEGPGPTRAELTQAPPD
jgi:hypothetical protein